MSLALINLDLLAAAECILSAQEQINKAKSLDALVNELDGLIAEAEGRRSLLAAWEHEERIRLNGQIDGLLDARNLLSR